MEPVEINAGTYYLRQLRADDRIDDRPALVDAFDDAVMRRYVPQYDVRTAAEAGDYIAERTAGWLDDNSCTWAIAEPTTGRLLGEVTLKNIDVNRATAAVAVWVHRDVRGTGVASTALDAALRFGVGALGLERVDYVCDIGNSASAALARKCGFAYVEPTASMSGEPSQLWRYPPVAENESASATGHATRS